jgi:hypothetical protein
LQEFVLFGEGKEVGLGRHFLKGMCGGHYSR